MHVILLPIAFCDTYEPLSSVFFEDQAKAIAGSGVKVNVIAVNTISLKNYFKKNLSHSCFRKVAFSPAIEVFRVQIPSLPKVRRWNDWVRLQCGKNLFKKYLRNHGKPDLLHVQVYQAGNLALWIKEKYHIPFVVTEHSSYFNTGIVNPYDEKLAARVFGASSGNISVSEQGALNLSKRFGTEFTYIPNVVDTDFFLPSLNAPAGHFVFLNIGSLIPVKNQKMLIHSFSKAFQGDESYQLIIAGNGPEKNSIVRAIAGHHIGNQVSIMNKLSREEVLFHIQNCSCLILPSLHETFGIVLIEALSCGKPVIATKCVGPLSIIKNDQIGFLCEIDEDSISSAMVRASSERFDNVYLRNYAMENFSSTFVGKRIKKFYEQIIE